MQAYEKIFEKIKVDYRGEDPGRALQVALSLLQPQEAEVIRLRFGLNEHQEEFSPAAIAGRLGIPPHRVRDCFGAGLKRLKGFLTTRVAPGKAKIVTKTCSYPKCGAEFKTHYARKKFCNRKCWRADHNLKHPHEVRHLSGKATIATHLKKLGAKLKSVKKTCKYAKCGTEFKTTRTKKEYCCRKCQIARYRRIYSSTRVRRLSGKATTATQFRIMRERTGSPTQDIPPAKPTPQIATKGETMKFLEEQREHVHFTSLKVRINKNGGRQAKLSFSLDVSPDGPNGVPGLPEPMEAALDLMARDEAYDTIGISELLKGRDIEIRALPSDENPALTIASATLGNFQLDKNAEGQVHLSFDVNTPLSDATGRWAIKNFGLSVWMTVFDAQRNLDMPPGTPAGGNGRKGQSSKKKGPGKPYVIKGEKARE